MSALDFPNTSGSYSVNTYPTISDNTWTFVGWLRTNVDNVGGTLISGGDVDVTAGFILGTQTQSSTTICVAAAAKHTGGTKVERYDTTRTWSNTDGVNRLICITCDGTDLKIYSVEKGGTCGSPTTGAYGGGTGISTGSWLIGGYRPFGATSGNLPHFAGEVAYFDYSLSASDLTYLATGVDMNAMPTRPVCYWRFRNGDVSTEPNVGTGGSSYDATKNGTSFSTGTDFWPDSKALRKMHYARQRNV